MSISAANVAIINGVLSTTVELIRAHAKNQSDLFQVFDRAIKENRDLTEEEVQYFKDKAKEALATMESLNAYI